MRISRNSESSGRPLSTADLATAGRRSGVVTDEDQHVLDDEHAKAAEDKKLTPDLASGRQTLSADEPNTTRLKDKSAEPVSGRPAADQQLRTSEVGSDIETHRTNVGETDRPPVSAATRSDQEALVALFTPELTETYRSRWTSIQSSFVDDPKQAVRSGDELVAQVMTNLANSFAEERHRVEAQLGETGEGSTESLRVALRRYRSFFDRLLSL
jgi:hypothetical protein